MASDRLLVPLGQHVSSGFRDQGLGNMCPQRSLSTSDDRGGWGGGAGKIGGEG